MTKPNLTWTKDKSRVTVNGDTANSLSLIKASKLYSLLRVDTIRARKNRGASAMEAFYEPKHCGKKTLPRSEIKKIREETKAQEKLKEYKACQKIASMKW